MNNFRAYFSTGEGIEDVLHIELAGNYLATIMAFDNHCNISIHEMGKAECLSLIAALNGRLAQLAEKESPNACCVDFEVWCDACGEGLCSQTTMKEDSRKGRRIHVAPCQACLDAAKGREEGKQEGYSEGYDEGYRVGTSSCADRHEMGG